MNIQVSGSDSDTRVLRGYLESLGYPLTGTPDYSISLEHADQSNIVMQGTSGEFCDCARSMITELTQTPLDWQDILGGSNMQLRVVMNPVDADAVERGLLRALLRVTGHGQVQPPAIVTWTKRVWTKRVRNCSFLEILQRLYTKFRQLLTA